MTNSQIKNESLTHAYGHRLADVHLAGFAPAFTLSLCDSEYTRKPPVPIASVVRCKCKKKQDFDYSNGNIVEDNKKVIGNEEAKKRLLTFKR